MPEPEVFIQPDTFAQLMVNGDVTLLDVGSLERYREQRISGASHLDYSDLVDARLPVMGLLPDLQRLGEGLTRAGVRRDRPVLAYDDEGGGRCARLFWTLSLLGQPCKLLHGGLRHWLEMGLPVDESEAVSHDALSQGEDYIATLAEPHFLADGDWLSAQLQRDDLAVLDVRTEAEFSGQDLRAQRGGHVPGAVNLDWRAVFDNRLPPCQLLPDDSLRRMLANLGITPDHEVVVYCQTHHRSSHTFAVLRHLGFGRVRGYHGAWSEWGNRTDLPLER